MLYKINSQTRARNTHTALIAPPLTLIMVFCFALVLLQPHPSRQEHTQAVTTNQASSDSAAFPLPGMAFAPTTSLPSLELLAASQASTNLSTASPQPAPQIDSNLLQAAEMNNQQPGISPGSNEPFSMISLPPLKNNGKPLPKKNIPAAMKKPSK